MPSTLPCDFQSAQQTGDSHRGGGRSAVPLPRADSPTASQPQALGGQGLTVGAARDPERYPLPFGARERATDFSSGQRPNATSSKTARRRKTPYHPEPHPPTPPCSDPNDPGLLARGTHSGRRKLTLTVVCLGDPAASASGAQWTWCSLCSTQGP